MKRLETGRLGTAKKIATRVWKVWKLGKYSIIKQITLRISCLEMYSKAVEV